MRNKDQQNRMMDYEGVTFEPSKKSDVPKEDLFSQIEKEKTSKKLYVEDHSTQFKARGEK